MACKVAIKEIKFSLSPNCLIILENFVVFIILLFEGHSSLLQCVRWKSKNPSNKIVTDLSVLYKPINYVRYVS